MIINISEFLSLTLQEPLSPSTKCYISVDVFSPHMSAVTVEGEYMLICTERKKCSNKVLNKAQYKFCMQSKEY